MFFFFGNINIFKTCSQCYVSKTKHYLNNYSIKQDLHTSHKRISNQTLKLSQKYATCKV